MENKNNETMHSTHDTERTIEETKKSLDDIIKVKLSADAQLGVHRKNLSDLDKDIISEGYDPKDLDGACAKLEAEISEGLNQLETILPPNIIEKYKHVTVEQLNDYEALKKLNDNQVF